MTAFHGANVIILTIGSIMFARESYRSFGLSKTKEKYVIDMRIHAAIGIAQSLLLAFVAIFIIISHD